MPSVSIDGYMVWVMDSRKLKARDTIKYSYEREYNNDYDMTI
jgi:fibronectin type 3 domain-containing protein